MVMNPVKYQKNKVEGIMKKVIFRGCWYRGISKRCFNDSCCLEKVLQEASF